MKGEEDRALGKGWEQERDGKGRGGEGEGKGQLAGDRVQSKLTN